MLPRYSEHDDKNLTFRFGKLTGTALKGWSKSWTRVCGVETERWGSKARVKGNWRNPAVKERKSVQRQEEELQRHRCWREPLNGNFLSCSQVGQLSLWVQTGWSGDWRVRCSFWLGPTVSFLSSEAGCGGIVDLRRHETVLPESRKDHLLEKCSCITPWLRAFWDQWP